MDRLLIDLHHGWRAVRGAPGTSLVAVLTLAVGLGAVTTFFGVLNAMLWKPLPFPEADRLVAAAEDGDMHPFGGGRMRWATFQTVQDEGAAIEVAGIRRGSANLRIDGGPARRVSRASVTAGFPRVLALAPVVGGLPWSGADPDPGAALLSERLWRDSFGGDPAVVGRTVTVNGEPVTVAGVLPSSAGLGATTDLWTLLDPRVMEPGQDLAVVGRLTPGATVASVQAALAAIPERLRESALLDDPPARIVVTSSVVMRTRGLGPLPGLMTGAGLLVLLVACANVGGVLLARAAGRRGSLAVRAGLGASRLRLAEESLAESLLLTAGATMLGLGLAVAGQSVLERSVLRAMPGWLDIGPDWRVFAFVALAGLAAVVVMGLAPALMVGRTDPAAALKDDGVGGEGRDTGRLRSGAVVGQVALSFALVGATGLLVESLVHARSIESGMDQDRVLTARIALEEIDDEEVFWRNLRADVASLPGVEATATAGAFAGWRDAGPVAAGDERVLRLASGEVVSRRGVRIEAVDPTYFPVVGLRLEVGRLPGADGSTEATAAGVVSRSLAERLWPGSPGVGERVTLEGRTVEVVGVVEDARGLTGGRSGYALEPRRHLYLPTTMVERGNVDLLARTPDPAGLAPLLRDHLAQAHPDQALSIVRPLEDEVLQSVQVFRILAGIAVTLGGIALGLALLGLYGTLSYRVRSRTREMGVRLALGAETGDLARLVVGQGVGLVAMGVGLGLALGIAAGALLRMFLYGVSPADPLVHGAVAILFLALGVGACLMPLRDALSVDPARALASE